MRNIIFALVSVAACDMGDNATYDRVEADRALVWRVERACIDLGEPIAWTAVQYDDGALSWYVVYANDDTAWMEPSVQFVGYRGEP